MKALKFFLFAAALAVTLSCEKDPQDNGNGNENGGENTEKDLTVTLSATLPFEGATLTWGSKITYSTDVDEAVEVDLSTEGTFTATVSAEATKINVTYGSSLPAKQAYVNGKFDLGSYPCSGSADIADGDALTVTCTYDFSVVKYEFPSVNITEESKVLSLVLTDGENQYSVDMGEGVADLFVYIALPYGTYDPSLVLTGVKAQFDVDGAEFTTDAAQLYTQTITAENCTGRHILVREGDDLQADLNSAVVGIDDVYVQGVTFKGVYNLVDGISLYGGWDSDFTDVKGKTILDGEQGGVVLNTKSNFNNPTVISDFEIRGGKSESDGGGALIRKNMTLQNCLITENEGKNGAGVYVREGGIVRNCIITNNKATSKGGGVQIYKLGTLENCTVTGNSAASDGGGMRLNTGGDVLNCLFADNTCEGDGASGIAVNGDARNRLINVTIAGNHNTTSATNTYGIYFNNNGRMTNCIVYGNTVEGVESPAQIYLNHKYPYLWNNAITADGIKFHAEYDSQRNAGTQYLTADVFTDSAKGDYTLKSDALCIDKGATTTVSALQNKFEEEAVYISKFTTDLVGKTRICGDGIDCGCYEYQK